ncbi:MAG: hypothetical protein IKX56_00660 [Muribaculaceae bacterium]|nr:hypothetical protein [Muribaculaceae bacterium]
MELIAQTSLLAAAALDLIAMLRHDELTLQSCAHSNSDYNRLLKKNSEISSVKRLLPFAVTIGACTTMAQMSWIVVFILAAVILAQALYLLWPNREGTHKMGKRSWGVYCLALALAIILPALLGYFVPGSLIEGVRTAVWTILLEIIISPALVMLANWLPPRSKTA